MGLRPIPLVALLCQLGSSDLCVKQCCFEAYEDKAVVLYDIYSVEVMEDGV